MHLQIANSFFDYPFLGINKCLPINTSLLFLVYEYDSLVKEIICYLASLIFGNALS